MKDLTFDSERRRLDGLDAGQLVVTLVGEGDGKAFLQRLTGLDPAALPVEEGLSAGTQVYTLRENTFFALTPWSPATDGALAAEPATDLLVWVAGRDEATTEALDRFAGAARTMGVPAVAALPPSFPGDHQAEGVALHIPQEDEEEEIPRLTEMLLQALEGAGKELLLLRVCRYKEKRVVQWVTGAAALALGIAALPLAGAGTALLATLQTGLCLRIAWVYGQPPATAETLPALAAVSAAGRRLSHLAHRTLDPATQRLPKALRALTTATLDGVLAAALTYGLGMTCLAYYKYLPEERKEDLTAMIRRLAEEYLTPASTRPDAPA